MTADGVAVGVAAIVPVDAVPAPDEVTDAEVGEAEVAEAAAVAVGVAEAGAEACVAEAEVGVAEAGVEVAASKTGDTDRRKPTRNSCQFSIMSFKVVEAIVFFAMDPA